MAGEESLFLPVLFIFPLCASLPFSPSWFPLNLLAESTGSSNPAWRDAELPPSALWATALSLRVCATPSPEGCSAPRHCFGQLIVHLHPNSKPRTLSQACLSYLQSRLQGCSHRDCVLPLFWRHKMRARAPCCFLPPSPWHVPAWLRSPLSQQAAGWTSTGPMIFFLGLQPTLLLLDNWGVNHNYNGVFISVTVCRCRVN